MNTYPFAKQGIYNITPATKIMTHKELLLNEVSMLQAHYNNLVKAQELAKDDWDKSILLSISSGILVSIGNIMDVLTKMK